MSRWPQPAAGEGAPTGGGREERRRKGVDGGRKEKQKNSENILGLIGPLEAR
jgi:hypothetical protein